MDGTNHLFSINSIYSFAICTFLRVLGRGEVFDIIVFFFVWYFVFVFVVFRLSFFVKNLTIEFFSCCLITFKNFAVKLPLLFGLIIVFILFYQKNNKLEHFQSQQILQNIVLIDFMNKLMKYLKHLTKEKMIHGKIKKILKKLLSNI